MNFDDLTKILKEYSPNDILFVGLGNDYRGDDGVGLFFLKRLQQCPQFSDSHFLAAGTNPENYLQKILDYEPHLLIFIDCAEWHSEPGTIDWLNSKTIDAVNISTHAFSMKLIENFLKFHQEIEIRYIGIHPFEKYLGKGMTLHLAQKIDEFFHAASKPQLGST